MNPIRNAPVMLTTKMPHGKAPGAAADQLVDAVACQRAERSGDSDPDHDGHAAEDTGRCRRSIKSMAAHQEEARQAGSQAAYAGSRQEADGEEDPIASPS